MKQKERIILTGCSGFIGQYLVKALQDTYEVHGMYEQVESMAKNKLPDSQQHVADLRDKAAIETLIEDIKPDYIIHLAAKTEVALSFENYTGVSEVNYIGTVNLAEANRKYNPNLKLFVMASTMETYGHHDPKDGPFTEETEQRPSAPYAVAKLACEYYLKYMAYAYDFPFTILRQTNAYGRTDNDFFVVERIITQMLEGGNVFLGDPRPIRNFIWIDDLIDLYGRLLNNPELVKGEVFCVGPDNGLTIEELAHKCAALIGWQKTIYWHNRKDGLPDLPGEIFYLNSSNAKASRVLGWEPKVTLDEGLKRTIDIWKARV